MIKGRIDKVFGRASPAKPGAQLPASQHTISKTSSAAPADYELSWKDAADKLSAEGNTARSLALARNETAIVAMLDNP